VPTPLTNDRWGYESNCFVCEASNEAGLRIPFQLDDDGDTVSAVFRLDGSYSGAPALVHGGVSLAVLDEAQAWACIAVAGKWGLTASTAAAFPAAVFIDHEYRVQANVAAVDGVTVSTKAEIVDTDGIVLVTSSSTFHIVGEVDVETGTNHLDDRQRKLLGD
jgi:acyl-coenzyme A thioesterase PaaI-like protein